jgi:hypothetical protein
MNTEISNHIVAVFSLALLCGFFVIVQLLARKNGVKHHLDNGPGGCKCKSSSHCHKDCES